jgi:cardiolipin synthase
MAAAPELRPAGRSALLSAGIALLRDRITGNFANILTASRLVFALPLAVLIWRGQYTVAFWLFLILALTDIADGLVAKYVSGPTRFGAIIDPVSDKTFLGLLFITLGLIGALPWWLIALALVRDALLVVGAVKLRSRLKGFRVEPLIVGKLSTFLQLLLVGFVLGGLAGIADTSAVVGQLVPVVAFVTLASALAYLGAGLKALRERAR